MCNRVADITMPFSGISEFMNDVWIVGLGNEVLLALIIVAVPLLVLFFHLITTVSKWIAYIWERLQTSDSGEEEQSQQEDAIEDVVDRPLPEHSCCICLEQLTVAVETNCGHHFCGHCLLQTFRHRPLIEVIKPCPLCRANVTLIMTRFTPEERQAQDGTDLAQRRIEIRNFVTAYNRQSYGVPRSIPEFIRDIPFLIRNFTADFFSVRGLFYLFQLRMGFCISVAIAYLLSPLDIIPESVYGILGLVDDLFVFVLLCMYVSVAYRGLVLNDPFLPHRY
ncbi:E3 ubiquitin-protein ligase RNF170-like [Schistocerca cancellata]|uniref:E3 ubiquitin-protein ligase RNF170-like n=1 Tax=Schistocerca cancellata TaxID=274614 RepID=UPI0021181693|nr:E3 ubiquitin-protein ligase RNF170-like [Schistocerca cancellata]